MDISIGIILLVIDVHCSILLQAIASNSIPVSISMVAAYSISCDCVASVCVCVCGFVWLRPGFLQHENDSSNRSKGYNK